MVRALWQAISKSRELLLSRHEQDITGIDAATTCQFAWGYRIRHITADDESLPDHGSRWHLYRGVS